MTRESYAFSKKRKHTTMKVKQFELGFGWITGWSVCVLTTAKQNLQGIIWEMDGEEAGLEEAWDNFWNNTSFWDSECPCWDLNWDFSPERKSYNLLLHQCLWYKVQLVVNLLTGVFWSSQMLLWHCDRCHGGPEYLREYCSEPKQMLWMYGLHKDCLIGTKSATCIFLF